MCVGVFTLFLRGVVTADVRTGQHSQASGSAVVEVGRTKVVCSLYGPRSYTRASTQFSNKCVLNFDVKFAPFSSTGERRERGQVRCGVVSCACQHTHSMNNSCVQQADEREMSLLLGQVLSASVLREKYPKSAIDVFVMVVEDDGGTLAVALACPNASVTPVLLQVPLAQQSPRRRFRLRTLGWNC